MFFLQLLNAIILYIMMIENKVFGLELEEDKTRETSSSSISPPPKERNREAKTGGCCATAATERVAVFGCLSNGFQQMTSISQSVLMALTVTVNKFASSNVHAVNKKEGKRPPKAATRAADIGRRGVLLSTMVDVFSVNDSISTELLKSTQYPSLSFLFFISFLFCASMEP